MVVVVMVSGSDGGGGSDSGGGGKTVARQSQVGSEKTRYIYLYIKKGC